MAPGHNKIVAFDLDGVLIDSRRAVEMAYIEAGAELRPSDWGRSASEWMGRFPPDTAEKIHRMKQHYYPKMLSLYANPLAGSYVAQLLAKDGIGVWVLTSASLISAVDALRFLGIYNICEVVRSVPRSRKITALQRWSIDHRVRCYVDDDPADGVYPVGIVRFVDDVVQLDNEIRRFL